MAEFRKVATKLLTPSPFNPRASMPDQPIDELAASVRAKGILHPLVVRPAPTGDRTTPVSRYEIVCGHRRHRAADRAKLAEVPVMVRELTDAEALEVMVIENAQREDVHPLEEAVGYQAMVEQHGVEVDEIAAKVGKSRAYIYGRLKLCALEQEGREAFLAGRISASVAEKVARIPADLQADALKALRIDDPSSTPTVAWASKVLRERFMLVLKSAPFDLADAELAPEAGACTTCPKRTGNQAELFADVDSTDVCTDPGCFADKTEAGWVRKAETYLAQGVEVLDGAASAELLWDYGSTVRVKSGLPYVLISETCYDDPDRHTYAKLLGSKHPGRVMARSKAGKPVTLFPKAVLRGALQDRGHDFWKRKASSSSSSSSASAKRHETNLEKQRHGRQVKTAGRLSAFHAIGKKLAARKTIPPEVMRIVARSMAEDFGADLEAPELDAVLDVHGLERVEERPDFEALEELVDGASADELPRLIVELLVGPLVAWTYGTPDRDRLVMVAKALGVDVAKLTREAKAKIAAEAKAEKAKGAA